MVSYPYLNHLTEHERKKYRSFYGLEPEKTTAKDAEKLENSTNNPFTGRPFSSKYSDLLAKRRELPIYSQRQEFLDMAHSNQFIVLVGETGSGKTTQISQFLAYDKMPHLDGKMIACTQPRRISVTSVAKRVADEMDVELGQEVGYRIRFDDSTSPTTFLKYMTDGILLNEAIYDPLLNKYSVIILDEVHERTLNTDILLGLLKDICTKRRDLQIVVMSATLDTDAFQKYFNNAPLLSITGRNFPIEIHYANENVNDHVEAAIEKALHIHLYKPKGDILIFLTGEREIDIAVTKIESQGDKLLLSHGAEPLKVLPLYSSLPPNIQAQIFEKEPPGSAYVRKIIVSTNIAQTSLTVDGIIYVIDSGYAKQKTYNPNTRVESLLVTRISKESAKQRAGRAGRTQPGVVFRLYTEEAFNTKFIEQTLPEILTSNLGNAVLQLKKFGINNVANFNFILPPSPQLLMLAIELLNYLGALDGNGNLTPIGELMAFFPLDPPLSKMLIESPKYNCSDEIASIAALLSVPQIFVRPYKSRKLADQAKARFSNSNSDHIALLNAYNAYKANQGSIEWCYNNFLNHGSLQLADHIKSQLIDLMKECNIDIISTDCTSIYGSANIRKAVATGFFMQVAHLEIPGRYFTFKNRQMVKIHPSCCFCFKNKPQWIVYSELLLTDTNYVRICTEVNPEWLMEIAPGYFDLSSFPYSSGRLELQTIAGINKLHI